MFIVEFIGDSLLGVYTDNQWWLFVFFFFEFSISINVDSNSLTYKYKDVAKACKIINIK